jgi:hypothetical protein
VCAREYVYCTILTSLRIYSFSGKDYFFLYQESGVLNVFSLPILGLSPTNWTLSSPSEILGAVEVCTTSMSTLKGNKKHEHYGTPIQYTYDLRVCTPRYIDTVVDCLAHGLNKDNNIIRRLCNTEATKASENNGKRINSQQ